MTSIDYNSTNCYESRTITSTSRPKFKLDAYCINLEYREQNMDFIHSEWDEYLNIKRFIALSTATDSHVQILKNIYQERNSIKFPIVIMEATAGVPYFQFSGTSSPIKGVKLIITPNAPKANIRSIKTENPPKSISRNPLINANKLATITK